LNPPDTIATREHHFRPLRPGPGKPRQEVAADQRARIEQAMVELVGGGGYESVTVRKLAAMAHVSPGTFYSLFSGTDQCFLEVQKVLVLRARERISNARVPRLGRREQATRSLRALIDALTEDPVSGRIIVMEVFAGGPAALGRAREAEARLETGLKESLDRRGDRIPATVVTWITAGVLHWARSRVGADVGSADGRSVDDMVRWGQRIACCGGAAPSVRRSCLVGSRSMWEGSAETSQNEEKELLLAAARKLAVAGGYRKLTLAPIARAAGLTTTAFRRHFASVEAIYLEVARRLTEDLFGIAAVPPDRSSSPPQATVSAIARICGRVVDDPATARVALVDILEPGRNGLACKAALTARIAAAWRPDDQSDSRRTEMTTEAAVAALWAVLADEVAHDRPSRLPKTVPTFAQLFALAQRRPLPAPGPG
jgi:AcrR family transcriptional regulator